MRFKIKLHTVNVIESVDGNILSVRSFSDAANVRSKSNKRAERLFVKLVKEHNKMKGPKFSKEDFEAMLDDGVYDDECGYQLFLVHSV